MVLLLFGVQLSLKDDQPGDGGCNEEAVLVGQTLG